MNTEIKISVIMPFHRRFGLFARAITVNKHFLERCDTELLAIIDDPEDELPMLDFVERHRELRVVVVVNDVRHDWRPPSKAINVGVTHASGSHVVIMSPENMIRIPSSSYLVKTASDCAVGGESFQVSTLPEKDSDILQHLEKCHLFGATNQGYGFLMCPVSIIRSLCGLDESRVRYGDEDRDLRERMKMFGVRFVVDTNIRVFVVDHDSPRSDGPFEPLSTTPVLEFQRDSWGRDFSRVQHDWKLEGCPNSVICRECFRVLSTGSSPAVDGLCHDCYEAINEVVQ